MADIGSYLSQFGAALEPLAAQNMQRGGDKMMGQVFALNPEFGKALYGAKNDAATLSMEREEYRRKMAQQQALRQLAGELGGINPRDPAQRQSALARYGQITGDIEPMFGIGANSQLPAPIQIANEIAARRAAGDFEGAKLLEQAAKLGEKGTYTDPQTGEVKVIPGYVPAVSAIEGGKADAGNISDMNYDPVTAGLSEKARLEQQLATEPAITAANEAEKLKAARLNETAKKVSQSSEVINLADEAETYLDKATGSGIGAIGAAGKKFIGRSDESTQANAALEVIGGKLVSNVPRMEGPQSDKDIQMYRDMAGRVADPSVPANDKRAALAAIKALAEKYAAQNSGVATSPAAPPTMQETPRQKLERLRRERGQ